MTSPELIGGRYELRGVLGRGGMAEVHSAWDVRLNRPVAVKLLHPSLLGDPDSRTRFEFEARAAAGLAHPNIVVVHDSGEQPPHGVPFLVMEQLPGASLADEIARGPLPVPRVRSVLADVLAGLGAAHAAGILHRDVKPANVLFAETGQAKLADFGIAKSGSASLTRAGQIFGTMAYLSPERIAGRPATPADDLYAVGAMGYEALTGAMPFPQSEPAALVRAIAAHDVVPLQTARPDVDAGLATVIERAMAPDPSQRFSSAAEMRAALLSVRPATRVMTAPPLPMTTGAVLPPPPPDRRRRVMGGVAAGAAVLLALVFVIVEATRSSPATPSPAATTTPTTTTSSTTTTTTTPPPTTSSLAPAPIQTEPRRGPGNGNDKPKKPKGDDD
ncbi:hypothetical protein MARA_49980 [Mycolicibacterium arabiense]|uniref:non-specific serine/threonine protein kinase n=1 Tax=Mycolicibacterium arabiense TaxID=1286181 RepID=A0A7I7S4X8_9MYCO|nr:serine/threonine-protein kinase [Mycolicibacterium arabiense]MCV7372408.1 serine/threonine protein kinase [Mycolicibacterium arabiense]BBY51530.1 hypothetical protein MARA_49980 [Mycolicibacterium arabiense]